MLTEHPEHGAGAQAVVVVGDGGDARAGVPGVVALPGPGEDPVVHPAEPVPVALPALDAAPVDVRAQREVGVARLPDADPVRVGHGLRQRDRARRVRRRPQPDQGFLGFQEVGVGSGLDLRTRPVELEHLGVVLGERY